MKKVTLYDIFNRSDEFIFELFFIWFFCSCFDDIVFLRIIGFLCFVFPFVSIGYFIRVEEMEDRVAK